MIDRLRALRSDLLSAGFGPAELAPFAALLDHATEPFDRFRYRPGHITGSALVSHPSLRAVALVHHDKLDLWVQPGGHVEPGDESVETGARREVTEEVGLVDLRPRGIVDVDVHLFPERAPQPRHLHYDVRYAFEAGDDRLVAGDGVRQVRWVPLDEALGMDESVARAVRRMAATLGW